MIPATTGTTAFLRSYKHRRISTNQATLTHPYMFMFVEFAHDTQLLLPLAFNQG